MRLMIVWIGGLVLAAGLAGCVQKQHPAEPGFGPANDELAQRVARDPLAVLQEGLIAYDRDVTSYTCTLYKQERVDPKGPMGPRQKTLCKFMEKPFSVCVETIVNPIGAKKTLYIEGKWGNKMLAQPAGVGALLGDLLVEPRGVQARANTLRFIDQFGLKRTTENLVSSGLLARKEGIFSAKLLGTGVVEGRNVIVYEARITEPKPSGRFGFPRLRVHVDSQLLLPIAVDTWDADGIERGHYSYADLNLKAGLTAKDFVPESNGMKSPK